MHEVAITKFIIKEVEEIASKNNIKEVTEITILVGKMHAIIPQIISEIFDIMKREVPLISKAKLTIKECDIKISCKVCNKVSYLDTPFIICPVCNSSETELISGKELLIEKIKGTFS